MFSYLYDLSWGSAVSAGCQNATQDPNKGRAWRPVATVIPTRGSRCRARLSCSAPHKPLSPCLGMKARGPLHESGPKGTPNGAQIELGRLPWRPWGRVGTGSCFGTCFEGRLDPPEPSKTRFWFSIVLVCFSRFALLALGSQKVTK